MLSLKNCILCFLLILAYISSSAQTDNQKSALAKNKVKACRIKYCGLSGGGSCVVMDSKYDERGNTIEWDMSRLGTMYRDVYDNNNNRIMTIWVDKNDTTHLDTVMVPPDNALLKYDKNGWVVRRDYHNQENLLTNSVLYSYDDKGRLVEEKAIRYKNGEISSESITTHKYDDQDNIVEQYNHFSDPCMGWDDYYLFKNQYSKKGLLISSEALRNRKTLDFTISYEYVFSK